MCFEVFKYHVKNNLVKLRPKIMGGGGLQPTETPAALCCPFLHHSVRIQICSGDLKSLLNSTFLLTYSYIYIYIYSR